MWLTPLVAAMVQVGQVAGTVRQDSSLVPVPNVSVEVVDLARAVVTDRRGNFVIQALPTGTWTVQVSAIGFDTARARVAVPAGGAARVDFLLTPAPVPLSGINVDVFRVPSVGPSPVRATMTTLALVPALAEVDVLRALEVLPAVASVSEYSTALYVRGGTPDQTDVLLDGFPVFNPFHLGGVYAAFNPDAVAAVEVVPGAMTATQGSRISSLVTVETREGGSDRVRSRGTVSLGSVGAALDGPVPLLAGTFLVSGRQSLRNYTSGGIAAEGLVRRDFDTTFHDLLGKWTLPWNGGAVEALWFSTAERIDLPQRRQGTPFDPALRHDWHWGSRLVGLSAHVPLGAAARVETRVGWSTFDTGLDTWWQSFGRRLLDGASATGEMDDRLVATNLVVTGALFGSQHQLSAGGEARRSSMAYDARRSDDPPVGLWSEFVPRFQGEFESDVFQFWLEDEVTLGSGLLGLRFGLRGTAQEGFSSVLQPRAGIRVALTDWLALTAGAGRYVQPVHSVRVEESLGTSYMAFDLLRPAAHGRGMPEAEDVVVGVETRRGPASLRLDAYAKRYRRLALPMLPANPWEWAVIELDAFGVGTATARGAEVLADYVRDPLGVWVSYSLQEVRRTLAGVTYAPRYQRTHTVDLLTTFALPQDVELNVRGIYGSGQPTTPVVAWQRAPHFSTALDGFDVRAERRVLLGDHNSVRLPAYLRLDAGARFHTDQQLFGRPMDLAIYAQVVNALNIYNTLTWNPSVDPDQDDNPAHQFPITLTAGVEWSF